MLIPAIFVITPLAMKPDELRLRLIDREVDRSEVFVGCSVRSLEVGEGWTQELVGRPIGLLACCRAIAGAFASNTKTTIGFVASGAQAYWVGAGQ